MTCIHCRLRPCFNKKLANMPTASTRFRRGLKSIHRQAREFKIVAKGLLSTRHPLQAHVIPMRLQRVPRREQPLSYDLEFARLAVDRLQSSPEARRRSWHIREFFIKTWPEAAVNASHSNGCFCA